MSDESGTYDWNEVIEEGQISWWHGELGGIIKSGNKYVSEMPFVRVVKLGPFDSLEEAKAAMQNPKDVNDAFEQAIAELNEDLTKKL